MHTQTRDPKGTADTKCWCRIRLPIKPRRALEKFRTDAVIVVMTVILILFFYAFELLFFQVGMVIQHNTAVIFLHRFEMRHKFEFYCVATVAIYKLLA